MSRAASRPAGRAGQVSNLRAPSVHPPHRQPSSALSLPSRDWTQQVPSRHRARLGLELPGCGDQTARASCAKDAWGTSVPASAAVPTQQVQCGNQGEGGREGTPARRACPVVGLRAPAHVCTQPHLCTRARTCPHAPLRSASPGNASLRVPEYSPPAVPRLKLWRKVTSVKVCHPSLSTSIASGPRLAGPGWAPPAAPHQPPLLCGGVAWGCSPLPFLGTAAS